MSSPASFFRHLALIASLFVSTAALSAQQVNYLVTAPDSSVSVFDLATSNLVEKIDQGSGNRAVVVGPNSRLAFVGSSSFVSVIDLTIGREIKRIRNVAPSTEGNSMAFTRDGRYLLVADNFNLGLAIIDAASLTVVHEVSLLSVMGSGAFDLNTVAVIGTKAYVTSSFPNPAIAVVDLNTFTARPINVPGFIDVAGLGTVPNAGITSDGRFLVLVQGSDFDGMYHMMFISTVTDRVVIDHVVPFDPDGVLINPVPGPGNQYGYLLAQDLNNGYSVTVIDLRPGSQTFGQLLPSTELLLPYGFFFPSGYAVSPDGTRLVVGQFRASRGGPLADVFVIDTAKLLANPSQAIVGQATVPGNPGGAALALTTTQAPPTAPTVTGVSGNITNDMAHTIHVFGTNFASGAQVRIGSMAPLPATVNSPTDLQVTVPANAPAAPNQDVIVTDPNANGPPSQQNQSGVLVGGLSIFASPLYQPANQIAAFNFADGSLSSFDFNQRAMTRVALDPPGIGGLTFNAAGTNLYTASNGHRYAQTMAQVLSLQLATDDLTPIPFNDIGRVRSFIDVVVSRNPVTGGPVVYSWIAGSQGLEVFMIDGDPHSPTFNTIIGTFSSEVPAVLTLSGTATPDGKYVYVNYLDADTNAYMIAAVDILHGGTATVINPVSFNASAQQDDLVISPDGSSLLLNSLLGGVVVLDISQNPLQPALVTTINKVSLLSFFYSYQVVGGRLFVLDVGANDVIVYNFDRQHSNFSRLATYGFQGEYAGNPYLAVSPDGSLIYLPLSGDDEISVLDANKLVNHQPPLITNLASFRSPSVIAVSPVSH